MKVIKRKLIVLVMFFLTFTIFSQERVMIPNELVFSDFEVFDLPIVLKNNELQSQKPNVDWFDSYYYSSNAYKKENDREYIKSLSEDPLSEDRIDQLISVSKSKSQSAGSDDFYTYIYATFKATFMKNSEEYLVVSFFRAKTDIDFNNDKLVNVKLDSLKRHDKVTSFNLFKKIDGTYKAASLSRFTNLITPLLNQNVYDKFLIDPFDYEFQEIINEIGFRGSNNNSSSRSLRGSSSIPKWMLELEN